MGLFDRQIFRVEEDESRGSSNKSSAKWGYPIPKPLKKGINIIFDDRSRRVRLGILEASFRRRNSTPSHLKKGI